MPTLEALNAGKSLEKIFIQRGSKGIAINDIQQAASKHNVPVQYVPKEKLFKFTNMRHQGVVALLSDIQYYEVEDIVDHCFNMGKDPLILVLDGITDVGNFGAICRSALGFHVDAIVIGHQNAAVVNAKTIKASAGAIHHIKICRHKYLEQIVEQLKNLGVSIVCLDGKGQKMISEIEKKGPLAIVMGNEDKGVRKRILELANETCKIPMNPKLESYNVSVATAIMLYESSKERQT